MLDRLLNDRSLVVMAKGLDGAELRHKVIADNLANVNTPNFKRVLVNFEEELKQALGRGPALPGALTNAKHIPINSTPLADAQPRLLETKEQTLRVDGNNVDVNVEMANMSANSLSYNALTTLFSRKVQLLKMVMRDRT